MKRIFLFFIFSILCLNIYSQKYKHVFDIYTKGDTETALVIGIESLKLDDNNTELNYLIGRILTEKKQFKKSIPYLEKGASKENTEDWIEAWSLAYLGVSCYYMDNFEKAKRCLDEAISLNATENVVKFAKKIKYGFQLDEYYKDWKVIETEFITFHFQNKYSLYSLEKYVKLRTDAYEKINEFFQASPIKKIDFFVWNVRDDAKSKLGRELGFADARTCIINSYFEQTFGHEITHILCQFGVFPIKRTRFINEGVAVYFDQTNRDRMKKAREALNGNHISILELWNNPKQYPDTYNYSVGGAFVEFLAKNGTENQLKKLLKEQTVENAEKIYDNFHELIREFEKELKI